MPRNKAPPPSGGPGIAGYPQQPLYDRSYGTIRSFVMIEFPRGNRHNQAAHPGARLPAGGPVRPGGGDHRPARRAAGDEQGRGVRALRLQTGAATGTIRYAQAVFLQDIIHPSRTAPAGVPRLWAMCTTLTTYSTETGLHGGDFWTIFKEYGARTGPVRDAIERTSAAGCTGSNTSSPPPSSWEAHPMRPRPTRVRDPGPVQFRRLRVPALPRPQGTGKDKDRHPPAPRAPPRPALPGPA